MVDCPVCKRPFSQYLNCNNHIKKDHPESKLIVCGYCGGVHDSKWKYGKCRNAHAREAKRMPCVETDTSEEDQMTPAEIVDNERAMYWKQWKANELPCPRCGSRELSPPTQYCVTCYTCKNCGLEFNPAKPVSKLELRKLRNNKNM